MCANITSNVHKNCTVIHKPAFFNLHHVSACMGVLRYTSCNIYGGTQLGMYTLVQVHNTESAI